MTEYINEGRPVSVYHGITAASLLRRCAQAAPEEAQAMAHAAALMHAAEPITEAEWMAAENAVNAVEARLIAAWSSPLKLNRHGQPWGGCHPALR